MYIKPYYCHIEDINISYPEPINDLAKNLLNKLANEEIFMLLNYLKSEKPCQQRRPRKSHFTNSFIDKSRHIYQL